jgi:hypothetical protein
VTGAPVPFERRAAALRRSILLAVLLSVPTVFAIQPPGDPDLFWHLRAGEWIATHGSVPWTDPFSEFGAGRVWVAYSWLFEVGVREIFHVAGWTGIVFATALASLGLAALVLRLVVGAEPRFTRAIVLAAVGVVGLLRLASPRPWLFTIAFYLIEMDLVLDARRTGRLRKAAWLPLLFALWANLHIEFVYGLLLLGLLGLEAVFERTFRREPSSGAPVPLAIGPLVGLGVGCGLATLANPYGWGVWRVVFDYAGGSKALANVTECQALDFRGVADWAVLASVVTGALALGWRRERRIFPYLLLVSSCYLGFRAGRDSWLATIAGVALAAFGGAPASESERYRPGRLAVAAIVLGIALELFLVGRARNIDERGIGEALAKAYPDEACAFAEERELPGPLYNPFDWGGYLIFRLPRIPVGMDGRTNLHGDERIARSIATWNGAPGWSSDPELSRARVVIAPAGSPLTERLRTDARFGVAHVDSVAVVFTARGSH